MYRFTNADTLLDSSKICHGLNVRFGGKFFSCRWIALSDQEVHDEIVHIAVGYAKSIRTQTNCYDCASVVFGVRYCNFSESKIKVFSSRNCSERFPFCQKCIILIDIESGGCRERNLRLGNVGVGDPALEGMGGSGSLEKE